MNKNEIQKLTETYFECFCTRNINELKTMYADNIEVSDPSVTRIKGIESVLKSNADLFGQFVSIDIQLKSTYIDAINNTSISEFLFIGDETQSEVVDIISFNESKKIVQVTAYFGKNNWEK